MQKISSAYILCGGKGTRLASLNSEIPKPMFPVAGKPVLEYILLQCKENGIDAITLITGYLHESIESYFGDGASLGLQIKYYQETSALGTSGALKELESTLPEHFFIFYGDVLFDMDLQRLAQLHLNQQSEMTLVVHPNDHPYDSDLVVTNQQGWVSEVLAKPHDEHLIARNLVSAAMYIGTKSIMMDVPIGKADWGRDLLPQLCKNHKIYAYRSTEYLKDMGTPDRLAKVEKDVLSGKTQRRNLKNKQKAIFLDRDGVLNYDTDLIKHPDELKVFPYTAASLLKINKSDYLSIGITNQSVVARNLTTEEGLNEIHKKLDTLLAAGGAYLDDLKYCPHHPDGGFPGENKAYKIVCECRKPKPGMILQAAHQYHIDLSQSYMIGDSERDIKAGKAAGVCTIGLKTGHGIKKTEVQPDYFFGNLQEAVDFIIDQPFELYATRLLQELEYRQQRPFVISIAGNTRSGKSTLATYTQKHLEKQGIKVLKIALDDWILPREERPVGGNVFDYFQIEKLADDIQKIMKGEEISTLGYSRHPLWPREGNHYKIDQHEVVILEGIIALSHPILRALSHLKIFKTVQAEVLKERVFTFYKWKGMHDGDIENQYNERRAQEFSLIEKELNWADWIL